MIISEKRLKFYQIANDATDEVYIGTTTQAVYKRLYIRKTDIAKGVQSRLCELMRTLGKDRLTIGLLEERVFTNADAVSARETYWMHENRNSLNEGYTQATTEVKEEQPLGLREYMLHTQELQHQVQTLET